MSLLDWVWQIYCLIFCAAWIFGMFYAHWIYRQLPFFADQQPEEPESWPLLSMVIAACNEEHTIEPALRSLLAEDYPHLEIIVVNDRSTDQTGAIIDSFSQIDNRVHPIHIDQLPEGWLGKVHALEAGRKMAQGELLLFTDADVHFEKGTLKKAVALMQRDQWDHITMIPKPLTSSFLFEVVILAFGEMFLAAAQAHKVQDPKSRAFMGCGAFNLVRKTSLDQTEGFEWLRLELADDVGLGLLLKRCGFRSAFFIAEEALSLVWYPSLGAMFKGLEKNSFAVMSRFSLWIMAGQVLLIWAFVLAPLLAFVPILGSSLWWAGASVLAGMVFHALLKTRMASQRDPAVTGQDQLRAIGASLLVPIGHLILTAIILRAGFLCWRRGDIQWRTTFYETEQLKRGQRLKPPFM